LKGSIAYSNSLYIFDYKGVKYLINKNREQIINRIIHLVDILGIKQHSGFPDINFSRITSLRTQSNIDTNKLSNLLSDLEILLKKSSIDEYAVFTNPITDVNDDILDKIDINVNEWRKTIPRKIKNSVNWDRYSLQMAIIFSKDILIYTSGKAKIEIETFIKTLEEIQEQIAEIDEDYINKSSINIEGQGEEWRSNIPELIKHLVVGWDTISIDSLKMEVSDLIYQSKGITKNLFEDYLSVIEDLEVNPAEVENDDLDHHLFDPLEIIDKYKNGLVRQTETTQTELDDSWRKMIPATIKKQKADWKTDTIENVYAQAKILLSNSKGKDWEEMMEFVSELSQIIYEQEELNEGTEEEITEPADEIADSIMSLVEMIILPRLEVIDLINANGGNIILANLWNKPFSESLKKEVKDRDHWKCVVCENETDLHVHHKIPRNLGGIHHIDNLVTLCASCHAAIETADIQHAFTKCWANYKKQKFSNVRKNMGDFSKDKKLLKEEVENSLDKLLIELNNKDEHKLMEDVMVIIKKLEAIFYD